MSRIRQYREALASQTDAVRIRVFNRLDWSVTATTVRSSAPRYAPVDCPVHSQIAAAGPPQDR
ncbi:hypothetical protein ACF1AB_40565 [Streptomyces sp. NPDC014846]|uniref:hypothetical protein n=1 Tax=Streptomyces sp. NPDC014846 TaxID=3364922 RepID=UPI0036F8CBE1